MEEEWSGVERRREDKRNEDRRVGERRRYQEYPNPLVINLLVKSANDLKRLRQEVTDCLNQESPSAWTRQQLEAVHEFALSSEAEARGHLDRLTQMRSSEPGIEP